MAFCVGARYSRKPLPFGPRGTFQVGRSPHEMPSSVSGRAAQIASTSSGRAFLERGMSSNLDEPRAGLDTQPAGPVGGRHLLLAERLDQAEPERRGARADGHGVLADE